MNPEDALADYWKRIKVQEDSYEEVTDEDGPFIKIMNVGEKIVVNRIEGSCVSSEHAVLWHHGLQQGNRRRADRGSTQGICNLGVVSF